MSLPEHFHNQKLIKYIKNNNKKNILKALMFLYSYKPKCYSKISKKIIKKLQNKITYNLGMKKKHNKIETPKPKLVKRNFSQNNEKINYRFQSKSDEISNFEDKKILNKRFKKIDCININDELGESDPSFDSSQKKDYKKKKGFLILNRKTTAKDLKVIKKKKTIKFTTKINKKKLSPISDIYKIKENLNNKGILLKNDFGIKIYDKDVFGYKTKKIVSKNILNNFIEQLSIKVKEKVNLNSESLPIFLNTHIMEKFTHNLKLSSDFCDYNSVKEDMSYIAKRSILEVFDIICIPFETNDYGFKLVIVDIKKSKLIYFDPLKVNKIKKEENSGFKYLNYVMKFLNLEYSSKTGQFLKKNWQIKDNNEFPLSDFTLNGFYISFYLYSVFKYKNLHPKPTLRILEDFYLILLKFIEN